MSHSFVTHRTPPVFLGLALLSLAPAGPVFGERTAAQAPSYGPVFRHAALEYMSSRQFSRVELEVGGSLAIQSVRLCFRAQQHRDFYFVEMTRERDRDRFVALLPMPLIETATVVYYFEVIDTGGRRFISSQFHAKVTATLPGTSSSVEARPTLDVRPVNPAAPAQPPGFRPDGMVRALADGAQAAASPGGTGQAPAGPTTQAASPPASAPTPPTTAAPAASGGGGAGAAVGVVLGLGAVGGAAYYFARPKEEEPSPTADLEVEMDCWPPCASPPPNNPKAGTAFSYRINVRNLGPSAATSVVLTDTIPSVMRILNVTGYRVPGQPDSAAPSCAASGLVVRCTVLSLPARLEFGVIIDVVAARPQSSVVNRCSASAAETDPNPANNSAEVTVAVASACGVSDPNCSVSEALQPVPPTEAPATSPFPESWSHRRMPSRLSWLTSLLLATSGQRGQGIIILNGQPVAGLGTSLPIQVPLVGASGENTIEAWVTSPMSGSLEWQFDFEGAASFVPGSLRAERGTLVALRSHAIAFRVAGTGDVLRFAFELSE